MWTTARKYFFSKSVRKTAFAATSLGVTSTFSYFSQSMTVRADEQTSASVDFLDLTDNRPHPGTLAKMSCLAYEAYERPQHNPLQQQKQSELHLGLKDSSASISHTYFKDLVDSGWRATVWQDGCRGIGINGERAPLTDYVGVVFEHPEKKQLVVAHRGTASFKDLKVDLAYVHRTLVDVHVKAMTFALEMSDYAKKHGYAICFTGHSLGGLHAILSLYAVKRYQMSPPACCVVTFDSPGAMSLLEELQKSTSSQSKVVLDALDITIFLSADAHVVNCCDRHVGTVYAIKAGGEHEVLMSANPFNYILRSHSMQRIAGCFDPETGEAAINCHFIRMASWPSLVFPALTPPLESGVLFFGKEIINNMSFIRRMRAAFNTTKEKVEEYVQNLVNNTFALSLAQTFYFIAQDLKQLNHAGVDDTAYQRFRQVTRTKIIDGQPHRVLDLEGLRKYDDVKKTATAIVLSLSTQVEEAALYQDNPTMDYRHRLGIKHFHPKLQEFLSDFYNQLLILGDNYVDRYQKFMELPEIPKDLLRFRMIDGNNPQDKLQQIVEVETIEAHIFRQAWGAFIMNHPEWLVSFKLGYAVTKMLEKIEQSGTSSRPIDLSDIVILQHTSWAVLRKLKALQTQSRLYLYGQAPQGELAAHEMENENLDKLISEVRLIAVQVGGKANQDQETLKIAAALDYQVQLLEIAIALNNALKYLKQQTQASKVLTALESVWNKLQNIQFKSTLKEDSAACISLEGLLACYYNLQGKALRQKADMKVEAEWRAVEDAYEAALREVPDDVATLSSLGALLDDVGDLEAAKDYHIKAIKALPISDEPCNKARCAVTYSNAARNCQLRATEAGLTSQQKIELLKSAELKLEMAIAISANAGSYFDRADVYLSLSEVDRANAAKWQNKAYADYQSGTVLEPCNPKCWVGLAEQRQKRDEFEKAEYAARKAIVLLEGLNPQAGEELRKRAETVIQQIGNLDCSENFTANNGNK